MARLLATTVNTLVLDPDTDTLWAYAPDTELPAGKVPVTISGLPAADPAGGGAAVTLAPYAGPEPNTRDGEEYPRLQVRVRHENPLAAMDLDRVAYDALATVLVSFGTAEPVELPVAAGQTTTYLLTDCYALQSDAQPLGRDESGRWEYVRNYQLTTERAPAA
jgi:hypothetical protein